MRKLLLIAALLGVFSCQKEIWLDDIDRLLTDWKSKVWQDPVTGVEKTYHWSNPQRFDYNDTTWGLWYLPVSGLIRETHFGKTDTTVYELKIKYIDKHHLVMTVEGDSTGKKIEYYAK
jgi:hypothetical protein